MLSALPYALNLQAATSALEAGASFADLGGNTGIVLKELDLNDQAVAADVSIVPDCGLAPGLANSLAVRGMELLDRPRDVRVWCGGLPQQPQPPLNYQLVFYIGGLSNEYTGKAVVLRDGRRVELDAMEELEELEFAEPVGRVEAFLTSGGTSFAPEGIPIGQLRSVRVDSTNLFRSARIQPAVDLSSLDEVLVLPGSYSDESRS